MRGISAAGGLAQAASETGHQTRFRAGQAGRLGDGGEAGALTAGGAHGAGFASVKGRLAFLVLSRSH